MNAANWQHCEGGRVLPDDQLRRLLRPAGGQPDGGAQGHQGADKPLRQAAALQGSEKNILI